MRMVVLLIITFMIALAGLTISLFNRFSPPTKTLVIEEIVSPTPTPEVVVEVTPEPLEATPSASPVVRRVVPSPVVESTPEPVVE